MSTITIRVERTTTEYADIEVEIDDAEFADWSESDEGLNDHAAREFVSSHRDYPETIRPQLSRARWTFDDDEIKLISRPMKAAI